MAGGLAALGARMVVPAVIMGLVSLGGMIFMQHEQNAANTQIAEQMFQRQDASQHEALAAMGMMQGRTYEGYNLTPGPNGQNGEVFPGFNQQFAYGQQQYQLAAARLYQQALAAYTPGAMGGYPGGYPMTPGGFSPGGFSPGGFSPGSFPVAANFGGPTFQA